jgi:hypothetical protein
MPDGDYLLAAVILGVGATLTMDLWSLLRRRLFGAPLPDYGLVGRWVAHGARGTFRHAAIKAAPRVRGERLVGWVAHYVTGLVFAAVLVALGGAAWLEHPTPALALGWGLVTVAAPFLVMQPAMGQGLAARRAPDPRAARLQSIVTHGVFGLGLYISAWLPGLLAG